MSDGQNAKSLVIMIAEKPLTTAASRNAKWGS
jgi:hypothetical protein